MSRWSDKLNTKKTEVRLTTLRSTLWSPMYEYTVCVQGGKKKGEGTCKQLNLHDTEKVIIILTICNTIVLKRGYDGQTTL